jgi:hypothetical protein
MDSDFTEVADVIALLLPQRLVLSTSIYLYINTHTHTTHTHTNTHTHTSSGGGILFALEDAAFEKNPQ